MLRQRRRRERAALLRRQVRRDRHRVRQRALAEQHVAAARPLGQASDRSRCRPYTRSAGRRARWNMPRSRPCAEPSRRASVDAVAERRCASPGAISRTVSGKPGVAQPLAERGASARAASRCPTGPMSSSGALAAGSVAVPPREHQRRRGRATWSAWKWVIATCVMLAATASPSSASRWATPLPQSMQQRDVARLHEVARAARGPR